MAGFASDSKSAESFWFIPPVSPDRAKENRWGSDSAHALKYPVLFNVRSTGFDVYFSTLSNLLQAIKVALTNDFIKYQIMRPWISATFANPLAQIGGDVMIADPVTNHLTTIEQMLFGSQRAAPVNAASSSFENREGGVLNKDWKSWLMGIPSYPIKNLRVVKAENERLWKIWEWEREHFQMDHALRLSVWFQEGRFFEEGHECFDKKLHLSALSEMLKHVGFDGVEGADGKPLVAWLAENEVSMEQTIDVSAVDAGLRLRSGGRELGTAVDRRLRGLS